MKTDSSGKHLFQRTPVVSALIVFILMAGIGGYLVYSKKTGRPAAQESRQKEKENREITDSKPVEKKKQVTLTLGWESDEAEKEEEFKNTVLETLLVTDVWVESPGRICFHAPPGSDERKEVMEEIAILYKDIVRYDKPVAVGFFISGRPVEIYHFFRD